MDIDLVFIDGSTRGIQSLLAGDLSFTEAVGTSAINGRIAGGDIAIVNGVVNTLPYYVIGKASIKSREDLKGRTAAVHIPGTAADFALRLALKQVGIPYNQIKAITVGGGPARISSVIAGQTDFTIVSDAEKIQGERNGLKVVIDMAALKVPFLYTCTATSRQMIREQPNAVQRMVEAIAAGVHFFKTNKEESIKIMSKYTRGPSRAILEGAYSAYSQLFVEDTYPTVEGLRNTLEVQSSWDPKRLKPKQRISSTCASSINSEAAASSTNSTVALDQPKKLVTNQLRFLFCELIQFQASISSTSLGKQWSRSGTSTLRVRTRSW